jgi:prefoldin subunit 5
MSDVGTMVTAGVALATAVVVLLDRLFDIRRQAKGHEAQIAAKDETIKLLKERLEAQQQLNPPKLREYLDAVTVIMEKHAATLTRELEAARGRNSELEARIKEAQRAGQDVELLRLASDTIAELGAAARDSYVRPRFTVGGAGEEHVETLRAALAAYLAASFVLEARSEGSEGRHEEEGSVGG